MSSEFDVVVLGGGISGTAAALVCAQSGARVCVISAAPGASAMFSGAWRGPCPPALRAALAAAGYQLDSCDIQLPHASGALHDASYATPSHNDANLHDDTLIVNVAGLPGFHAPGLAAQWSEASGKRLDTASIELANTPSAGWAVASLAGYIERDPTTFAHAIQKVAQTHRAKRVVVPAIIGSQPEHTLPKRVNELSGCTVGEALATPPSLPGWRLRTALQRVLVNARIVAMEGRAAKTDNARDSVQSIRVNGVDVRARSYILATGKYVSGGVQANGAFREPALDCPIWLEHLGEVFETPDPLILTDPERAQDQPLLRAGVHTDAEQRPVNHLDDVVYKNVFVAGSIRADWSSTTHGSGHCAEDGWNAGLKALRQ